MLDNQTRRELLSKARQTGFTGSILDVFAAYEQGKDLIGEFQQQQQMQQTQQLSDMAAQQSGLQMPQQMQQPQAQPQQQMPVVPQGLPQGSNIPQPATPSTGLVNSNESQGTGIASNASGARGSQQILATGGFVEKFTEDQYNKFSTHFPFSKEQRGSIAHRATVEHPDLTMVNPKKYVFGGLKYETGGPIGKAVEKTLSRNENADPETMFYGRYNTPLTERQQKRFDKWATKESERQGRDIMMDKGAYDIQGFWKAGDWKKMDADNHGTDTWKKPNHPTFSTYSKYHGADGWYGGNWTEEAGYQPSKQTINTYGPEYYSQLFGAEPNRIEHLDMSRYDAGKTAPSPVVYAEGGLEKDPPDWRNILNYQYSAPQQQFVAPNVRKVEKPTAAASTTSVKSAVPAHMVGKTKEEVKAIEADWKKAHEEQVAAERARIEKDNQEIEQRKQQFAKEHLGVDTSQLNNYEQTNTGEWVPKSELTKQLEAKNKELSLQTAAENAVYQKNNAPTIGDELVTIGKELPLALLGTGVYSKALGAIGKAASPALKNIFGSAYKINPMAGRLGQYNRVVGADAIADLRASGLVRSGEGAVTTMDGIPVSRPTAWPSFAKGAPKKTYMNGVIQRGDTPYIISTNRPMAVSTLGRHGKGVTQFPVGKDGKYLTSFPASEATVYEGAPHWLKGYQKVNTAGKTAASSGFRTDIPAFATELKGSIMTSKAERQAALDKANDFSTDWAQAPETWAKYEEAWLQRQKEIPLEVAAEYPTASATEQMIIVNKRLQELNLGLRQASTFKGRAAEYPLKKQVLDLLAGQNIHDGNWGVSYFHNYGPRLREGIESGLIKPRFHATQNWVSRTVKQTGAGRTSTGVHENTHDWIDAETLVNSGQSNLIRSFRDPKLDKLYIEWEALREQGKNSKEIAEIMGKENAYRAYLANPTEVHARIMELRNHLDFKPGSKITDDIAREIREYVEAGASPVDARFLENFKTDADLKNAFNKLFTPAAIVGGVGTGYLYNKKNNTSN